MPNKPVLCCDETGNDLKLQGDKINLSVRPLSKEGTASAKCAMLSQGLSRPCSAIPALRLYSENDYETSSIKKRPLSAGSPPLRTKLNQDKTNFKSKFSSIEDYEHFSSLQSSDDMEKLLPSSQLFQNLLSEPIKSWRINNEYDSSTRYQESKPKTSVLDNDAASVSSEQSLGSKIQSVAQNGFSYQERKIENNLSPTSEISDTTNLVPGLKTKPPLPKKQEFYRQSVDGLDSIKTDSNTCCNSDAYPQTFKPDNLYIYENGNASNLDKNMKENIINYDYSSEDTFITTPQKIHNNHTSFEAGVDDYDRYTRDFDSYGRDHAISDANVDINGKQCDSSAKIDAIHNFEQTKVYQGSDLFEGRAQINTGSNLSTISEYSDYAKTSDDIQLERHIQSWFDVDATAKNVIKNELETDLQLKKLKLQQKKLGKEKGSDRIAPKSAAESRKSKPKFAAKAVKTYPDFREQGNRFEEIDSWMTASKERPECAEIPKPTNYLDFLNTLDELENASNLRNASDVTIEDVCDLPEHDVDDTNKNDNTYEDIVSLLQVLEDEDKKSQMKIHSMKKIVCTELSSETHKQEVRETKSAQGERDTGNNKNNVQGSKPDGQSLVSLDSSANYNEILSFLDEVDRNCSSSLLTAKERVHSTAQIMDTSIRLETIPKIEDLMSHTNTELSHYIIDLSLRVKEKSSAIAVLQNELSALRAQITKTTKQTEQIVKQKLKSQKDECENVVKRHQKFIDQLITDKKTLSERCEGLVMEMKAMEDKYISNTRAAEQRHKVELQKVKDMCAAGEKIRRERWIDTKTQKIKELTVKGLEPELQSMAVRQQQELSDLRALQKREIEDIELKNARKMQQQCESLREQLTAERERALVHEREVLRVRYEKLVESEEKGYQEQRRRLLSEHANRVAECEERGTAAIAERDRVIKQAEAEFDDKFQAALRRHQNELKMLNESTELEMEAWKNNYKKQQVFQLAEKEAVVREKCKKERDREIEAVIDRLESEAFETKMQIEETTENRIRRLKQKYDNELRDVESSEKEAKNKYLDAKTKLLESEDLIVSLRSNLKQLEIQLREAKELSDKLSNERSKIKDVVREELRNDVEALEKEVEALREGRDKELHQVYSRVKVAVARKDEILSEVTRENASLLEKCAYLENMLGKQRKEYLIK